MRLLCLFVVGLASVAEAIPTCVAVTANVTTAQGVEQREIWSCPSAAVSTTETAVSISTVAPVAGQVLTATTSTTAVWQTPDAGAGGVGPAGPTGLTGPQGIQGEPGAAGAAGAAGSQGIQGATGPEGPAGTAGAAGAQGIQGIQGVQGNAGSQGIQGIQGVPGTSGLTLLQASGGTQSDATITGYTAITGIAWTPAANTNYWVDCFLVYTSTAATTGINFAFDVPTAAGINMDGTTKTVATGANEGFSQNGDNVGTSTSASVITVENTAVLTAVLRNGANATSTTLGFKPETDNSVSVIGAKSFCQYRTF